MLIAYTSETASGGCLGVEAAKRSRPQSNLLIVAHNRILVAIIMPAGLAQSVVYFWRVRVVLPTSTLCTL